MTHTILLKPDMSTYESVTLHLFRLKGSRYTTYATAKGDEILTLAEPFAIEINGNRLLGMRPDVR